MTPGKVNNQNRQGYRPSIASSRYSIATRLEEDASGFARCLRRRNQEVCKLQKHRHYRGAVTPNWIPKWLGQPCASKEEFPGAEGAL